MKVLNTLLNRHRTVFVLISLAFFTHFYASAQAKKTWCSDLYVGDIRVPSQQHLFTFRNLIRTNIAAILSDVGDCSIIERNKGLESLLERESQFFSERTFKQITDYTDQFKHEMRWVVLGELSPTNERNQYSLDIRIIRVASRASPRRFVYVFRIDEDYDQRVFDREFRSKFLEEMDQMFTFRGYLNSESNITRRNFRITPEPEIHSLKLDLETGAFEFKIPKHKFEHDTLSVEILGKNIYGTLKPTPAINQATASNTVRIGRIDVGKTTGQVIDMIWDGPPGKCDDFSIRKVTLFSANAFTIEDSIYINKTGKGFRLNLPSRLPNDTDIQVDIFSLNYKGYDSPGRFSLNNIPDKLSAGTYTPSLIRKIIPGLHQWNHKPKLLSPLIVLAQAGTLWTYFSATNKANQQKRDANLSTSFLTRQQLLSSASGNEDLATASLIAAIATYAFHWFHALFLKPCRNPTKTSQRTLSATISSGSPTLSLVVPIG